MKDYIEIIDGVQVDWSDFKSKNKGYHLERAKESYIEFCKLLHENGHTLESEYVNTSTKVKINYGCKHKPSCIIPRNYDIGSECKECKKINSILKNLKYTKICCICGKKFTTNSKNSKYCSDECKNKYFYIGKGSKVFYKTCEICGKFFTTSQSYQKLCSDECKEINKLKFYKYKKVDEFPKNKYTKICCICGKEFTTNSPQHRICSDKCREVHKWLGRGSKVFYKTCKACGKDFASNNSGTKLCSEVCRDIYSEKQKEKTAKSKAEKQKKTIDKDNYNNIVSFTVKELIKKGIDGRDNYGISSYYSSYGFTSTLKDEVRDRDNWTCRVCGNKHRLEVHHIVKVRHGGENELDNLITLCTSCHRAIDTLDLDHALKTCMKNAEKYLGVYKEKDFRTNKEIIEDTSFDLRAVYSILNRQSDDPDIQDALMILGKILDIFENIV